MIVHRPVADVHGKGAGGHHCPEQRASAERRESSSIARRAVFTGYVTFFRRWVQEPAGVKQTDGIVRSR
jgi:hypothetical protein